MTQEAALVILLPREVTSEEISRISPGILAFGSVARIFIARVGGDVTSIRQLEDIGEVPSAGYSDIASASFNLVSISRSDEASGSVSRTLSPLGKVASWSSIATRLL